MNDLLGDKPFFLGGMASLTKEGDLSKMGGPPQHNDGAHNPSFLAENFPPYK